MLKELFSYIEAIQKICLDQSGLHCGGMYLRAGYSVDYGGTWWMSESQTGMQDYILHKGLVMIGCAGLALVLGICSARFCALCGQGFGANLREAEYRKLQSYSFSNIDHFQVSFAGNPPDQ